MVRLREGGFSERDSTGSGGWNEAAGIVHREEFVVKAGPATQYRAMLAAMNAGSINLPSGGGSIDATRAGVASCDPGVILATDSSSASMLREIFSQATYDAMKRFVGEGDGGLFGGGDGGALSLRYGHGLGGGYRHTSGEAMGGRPNLRYGARDPAVSGHGGYRLTPGHHGGDDGAVPTGAHTPLKDLIAQHETGTTGPGGDDTACGHAEQPGSKMHALAPPKPITTMTIGEVLAYQREMKSRAGSPALPVGRGQWTESTLRGLTKGMDPTTKLTPELQERLFDRPIAGRMGQGSAGFRSEWDSLRGVPTAEIDTAIAGHRKGVAAARGTDDVTPAALANDAPAVAAARRYLEQRPKAPPSRDGTAIAKLNPPSCSRQRRPCGRPVPPAWSRPAFSPATGGQAGPAAPMTRPATAATATASRRTSPGSARRARRRHAASTRSPRAWGSAVMVPTTRASLITRSCSRTTSNATPRAWLGSAPPSAPAARWSAPPRHGSRPALPYQDRRCRSCPRWRRRRRCRSPPARSGTTCSARRPRRRPAHRTAPARSLPRRQSAPAAGEPMAMNSGVSVNHASVRKAILHVRTLKQELASLGTAHVGVTHRGFGTHGQHAPGAVRTALNGGFANDGRAFSG